MVVDGKIVEGFDDAKTRDQWSTDVLKACIINRIENYKKLVQPEEVKEAEIIEEKEAD